MCRLKVLLVGKRIGSGRAGRYLVNYEDIQFVPWLSFYRRVYSVAILFNIGHTDVQKLSSEF